LLRGRIVTKIVLSIDPGKKKCGIAIVDNRLQFITGEVVNTEELVRKVKIYLEKYEINNILIGSGTSSGEMIEIIRKKFPDIMVIKVKEKDTTMLARKRYFEYHPPTGLLKILPISFRIPPCPYDDFAAFVIAERFFQNYQDNAEN
jgi:RNase H-fold protein (predicted Holliday junction resolvase)